MPNDFSEGVDAALTVKRQNGWKIYFFKGDKYVRFSADRTPSIDPKYPKSISRWPGLA